MRMLQVALLVGVLAVLIVEFGPIIAGYHRGYGSVVDAISGEHCIRWAGSIWCRS